MKKKTILISNDDGYFAAGIEALICAFREKYNVFIVAPEHEQSGKSHSFTFHTPLSYRKIEREDGLPCFAVNGAPADCVKVALAHLMPQKPDYVLSGINTAENVGVAVFYSGTCAVAREAGLWRVPAVAFSNHHHIDDIKRYGEMSLEIFEKLREKGFLDKAGKNFYNVNYPDLPVGEFKGVKIARQSMAYYKDSYVIDGSEASGQIRLRANYKGMAEIEDDEEFDIAANFAGFATVTPILLDSTDEAALRDLRGKW